jgi:hypothetical protein
MVTKINSFAFDNIGFIILYYFNGTEGNLSDH